MVTALLLLITWGTLAYRQSRLVTASLLTAAILALGTLLGEVGPLVWLLFAVVAAVLNLPALRHGLLSRPLFKVYKGLMPEMSRTEKEAIEAGTTWWEAELFCGKPDWQTLHNYPRPHLSEEEQAFLDGPVE